MPLDHVLYIYMKMYYKQCAIGSCIIYVWKCIINNVPLDHVLYMKMYYKQCAIGSCIINVWKCIINNVPLDHVLYIYENVL